MKLLKSKRGSETPEMMLFNIIKILVAFVLIFFPLYGFIHAVTTSDFFERNYLARDVALLTDTVIASPNDLIYNYVKDTKKFNFNIKEKTVQVYEDKFDVIETYVTEMPYIQDPSTQMYIKEIKPTFELIDDNNIETPVKLSIVRSQNKIRFYNAREDIEE